MEDEIKAQTNRSCISELKSLHLINESLTLRLILDSEAPQSSGFIQFSRKYTFTGIVSAYIIASLALD